MLLLPSAAAKALAEFETVREAWATLRDAGTRHVAALGNAKQEATYVGGHAGATMGARAGAAEEEDKAAPVESARRRALEQCRAAQRKEHEKLCGIVRQMASLVARMSAARDALRKRWNELREERLLRQEEEKEEEEGEGGGGGSDVDGDATAVGVTWTARDLLHALGTIIESFRTELFLKASIVEDVVHQSDPDVMLSYSAAFLSEPYLAEDAIFSKLEAAKYELKLLLRSK
jgi:hypothetical protein